MSFKGKVLHKYYLHTFHINIYIYILSNTLHNTTRSMNKFAYYSIGTKEQKAAIKNLKYRNNSFASKSVK